jgi:DNA mismatch repair ATPase MutL
MYCKGIAGFDIVDNGCGYTQHEMETMCKILHNRERNEIYKKKSIGYRGEALSSICKSCKITFITRHEDEPSGLKVTFSQTGDIASLEPVELPTPGTVVEVREIFCNNLVYQRKFRSNIRTQFDNAIHILTSYSLIMASTVFHVSNGNCGLTDDEMYGRAVETMKIKVDHQLL